MYRIVTFSEPKASFIYRFFFDSYGHMESSEVKKAPRLALNFWPAGQNDGAGAKRRAWRIEIKPQVIRAGQSSTGTLMLHDIHRSAVTASADITDPSRLVVWASISICMLEERDCSGKTAKSEQTGLIFEYLDKCSLTEFQLQNRQDQ